MNKTKKSIFGMVLGAATWLCWTPPSVAQSPDYPIEADTLAVLRIDVEKLDIQAVTDWYRQLDAARDQRAPVDQIAGFVGPYRQALRSANVTEVAVTLSAKDLNRAAPILMAATDQPDQVKNLFTTLWQMTPLRGTPTASKLFDGVLVFGAETSIGRLGEGSSPQSDRFTEDIAGKRLDHQLLIEIPDSLRRTLASVWPDETPSGSPFEFSPRQLMTDLVSLRIEWSMPPSAAFETSMRATDAQAATRLNDLAGKLINELPNFRDKINRSVSGNQVKVAADASLTADTVAGLLNAAYRKEQTAREINSMKQVGLALHNCFAKNRQFPSDIAGDDGTPLLSWRVSLLPFLDQKAFFATIDQANAWNDQPGEFIDRTAVPSYFVSGSDGVKTTLRIPVIESSLWGAPETKKEFRSIIDGTSNTIAMAVAPRDQAVPWLKPGYWNLDEAKLVDSFFGDRETARVIMFDGAVLLLSKADMTEDRLRALLTHAGREVIEW